MHQTNNEKPKDLISNYSSKSCINSTLEQHNNILINQPFLPNQNENHKSKSLNSKNIEEVNIIQQDGKTPYIQKENEEFKPLKKTFSIFKHGKLSNIFRLISHRDTFIDKPLLVDPFGRNIKYAKNEKIQNVSNMLKERKNLKKVLHFDKEIEDKISKKANLDKPKGLNDPLKSDSLKVRFWGKHDLLENINMNKKPKSFYVSNIDLHGKNHSEEKLLSKSTEISKNSLESLIAVKSNECPNNNTPNKNNNASKKSFLRHRKTTIWLDNEISKSSKIAIENSHEKEKTRMYKLIRRKSCCCSDCGQLSKLENLVKDLPSFIKMHDDMQQNKKKKSPLKDHPHSNNKQEHKKKLGTTETPKKSPNGKNRRILRRKGVTLCHRPSHPLIFLSQVREFKKDSCETMRNPEKKDLSIGKVNDLENRITTSERQLIQPSQVGNERICLELVHESDINQFDRSKNPQRSRAFEVEHNNNNFDKFMKTPPKAYPKQLYSQIKLRQLDSVNKSDQSEIKNLASNKTNLQSLLSVNNNNDHIVDSSKICSLNDLSRLMNDGINIEIDISRIILDDRDITANINPKTQKAVELKNYEQKLNERHKRKITKSKNYTSKDSSRSEYGVKSETKYINETSSQNTNLIRFQSRENIQKTPSSMKEPLSSIPQEKLEEINNALITKSNASQNSENKCCVKLGKALPNILINHEKNELDWKKLNFKSNAGNYFQEDIDQNQKNSWLMKNSSNVSIQSSRSNRITDQTNFKHTETIQTNITPLKFNHLKGVSSFSQDIYLDIKANKLKEICKKVGFNRILKGKKNSTGTEKIVEAYLAHHFSEPNILAKATSSTTKISKLFDPNNQCLLDIMHTFHSRMPSPIEAPTNWNALNPKKTLKKLKIKSDKKENNDKSSKLEFPKMIMNNNSNISIPNKSIRSTTYLRESDLLSYSISNHEPKPMTNHMIFDQQSPINKFQQQQKRPSISKNSNNSFFNSVYSPMPKLLEPKSKFNNPSNQTFIYSYIIKNIQKLFQILINWKKIPKNYYQNLQNNLRNDRSSMKSEKKNLNN